MLERYLEEFSRASVEKKRDMLAQLKRRTIGTELTKFERKKLRKVYREELVKRSELVKIAAAWVITVPASALLGAMLYFMIFGMVNA